MKNIHLLATDKPSRLVLDTINNNLFLTTTEDFGTDIMKFQNIYIIHNKHIKDEIKEGDWILWKAKVVKAINTSYWDAKKIILTTNQQLISDGVQAISDEFLQWFVMNPSCEEVKVEKEKVILGEVLGTTYIDYNYKFIIPQEKTYNLNNLKTNKT